MLEDPQAESSEIEGRQARIQRTDEVFVEPLCFFDLKAYSLDGLELFRGQVDDKADAEVI